MNIRLAIIPLGAIRSGRTMQNFAGVSIYCGSKYDPGANGTNRAGFHYIVDKYEAVCIIPENETAGNGTRQNNNTTVSINIRGNSDGEILAAADNAAQLAADILVRHGYKTAVWKKNLYQHNDLSKENYPHGHAGVAFNWEAFVAKVNEKMDAKLKQHSVIKTPEKVFHMSKRKEYSPDPEVEAIQRNLNLLKFYSGPVDGIYGPMTRAAVVAFQRDHNIKADGVFGPETTRTMGGVWK